MCTVGTSSEVNLGVEVMLVGVAMLTTSPHSPHGEESGEMMSGVVGPE